MAGQKKSDSPSADRRRTAMIAIAWFMRMRSRDRTSEDERRFQAWLEEDSGNAAAFGEIETVWDTAGELETMPGLQVMRQDALRPRTGFLRRIGQGRSGITWPARPAGRTVWRFAAAAAAAMVALLIVVGLEMTPFQRADDGQIHVFETAAGQRHEFTLPDGSRVTLTSDSRLMMRYCARVRRVVLDRGEAYFRVAHDSERPFLVQAGSGTVTALGTEFDVYKKNGEVMVTLVNGSVEVAALHTPSKGDRQRRLKPGERISYDKSGLAAVQAVDVERAVSWRTGRISVMDEPLISVIDKMNRHSSRKLKMDYSDPVLRKLQVTGQFRTGRPELLVQYIRAAGFDVVWPPLKDKHGNILLRLRHDKPSSTERAG